MSFKMVKPSHSVLALLFFGLGLILPIALLLSGEILSGIAFLILFLSVLSAMIERCLFRNIKICEKGITYIRLNKQNFMGWDEIKIVGIGYIPIKAPGKNPWLYFATDGVSCPMLNGRMVNEKFFMVSYRKSVEVAVRLYWKNDIDGLDGKSDFEKHSGIKRKLT